MAIQYRADPRGMAQLATSAEMAGMMSRAAERVAASARAMPPARTGKPEERRSYQASFKVLSNRSVEVKGARSTPMRAGALVINDDRLERVFGSRNRTLYRALGALRGVRLS